MLELCRRDCTAYGTDVLQVSSEALRKTCPIPFDEGRLWKGANAAELKQDLQKHFQNITLVMDCVGCEKCKLWGKLQLLGRHLGQSSLFDIFLQNCKSSKSTRTAVAEAGMFLFACNVIDDMRQQHCYALYGSRNVTYCFAGIATSLKILFSQEDCDNSTSTVPHLHLERNEVIALVNLLERLSKSIEVVRTMSLQLADSHQHPQGLGAIQDVVQHNLQDFL